MTSTQKREDSLNRSSESLHTIYGRVIQSFGAVNGAGVGCGSLA
jgi:hypothetical protein